MPATGLSWCLEVIQEGLIPWYTVVAQEYSVLSPKEGKVYRFAKGGLESHLCDLKKENILLKDCWVNENTEVASNIFAGPCGLEKLWSFISQDQRSSELKESKLILL